MTCHVACLYDVTSTASKECPGTTVVPGHSMKFFSRRGLRRLAFWGCLFVAAVFSDNERTGDLENLGRCQWLIERIRERILRVQQRQVGGVPSLHTVDGQRRGQELSFLDQILGRAGVGIDAGVFEGQGCLDETCGILVAEVVLARLYRLTTEVG